jgi:hypothetical protein
MESWLVRRAQTALWRRVAAWGVALGGASVFVACVVYSMQDALGLLGLPLLLCGFDLVPLLPRLFRPAGHPPLRQLAEWGLLDQIAEQVQQEAGQAQMKFGRWTFTEHLLIHDGLFKFEVYPIWHLLWAYRSVMRTSYGFLRASDHSLVLCFYNGNAKLDIGEWQVDKALRHLESQAPWALFGYSKDLLSAFDDRNADFCATVEERRRRWQARLPPALP